MDEQHLYGHNSFMSKEQLLEWVDLLHLLAETAVGPMGCNVMMQPNQTSRRATMTSVALRIFEPLIPPHNMASLLQSMLLPTLRTLHDGGHLFVLLTTDLIRSAIHMPPPPPPCWGPSFAVTPFSQHSSIIGKRIKVGREPGDNGVITQATSLDQSDEEDSRVLDTDRERDREREEEEEECEEDDAAQDLRRAAEIHEQEHRSSSCDSDSSSAAGRATTHSPFPPSLLFNSQEPALPAPPPPLLQPLQPWSGDGSALSRISDTLRCLAFEVAGEWLDEYFSQEWSTCTLPLLHHHPSVTTPPPARPRMNVGAASGVARALLTPRYSVYLLYWYKSTDTDAEGPSLSTRLSPQEIESLVALCVRAALAGGLGNGRLGQASSRQLSSSSSAAANLRVLTVVGPGPRCASSIRLHTSAYVSMHTSAYVRMLTYADVCCWPRSGSPQ
jgi:hypothetical protein